MCCTVFLSMWLSNTSTTAMVMPIAEAVLQQLICTGLADSHNDSETVDAAEDESGRSASHKVVGGQGGSESGGGGCFSLCSPFVTSVVHPRSCFRQGGEPGEETTGAALPQREVRVCSSGRKDCPPPSATPLPKSHSVYRALCGCRKGADPFIWHALLPPLRIFLPG